eukprot:990299-Pelagomonas_calceolata.AAC.4
MQQQQCGQYVLHPRPPQAPVLGAARKCGLQQPPSAAFHAPHKDVRARIAAPEKPAVDMEVRVKTQPNRHLSCARATPPDCCQSCGAYSGFKLFGVYYMRL